MPSAPWDGAPRVVDAMMRYQVWPQRYGTRWPPWFPCLPRYWCSSRAHAAGAGAGDDAGAAAPAYDDPSRYEPMTGAEKNAVPFLTHANALPR